MANWKKLNKEFDDAMDNATDDDWHELYSKPTDEMKLVYNYRIKGYKGLLKKCKWWQFSEKSSLKKWINYYSEQSK